MNLYRILCGVVALLGLLIFFMPGRPVAQESSDVARVIVLEITGPIGPATYDYIHRELDRAAAHGATLVVLEMNTPGGLFSSTRDIIRDILASPVPVATYVSPAGAHAASAGTYILYASHIAAMAPSTNLGAATPINMDGSGGLEAPTKEDKTDEPKQDKALAAKMVNDAAAYIKGLAERHGRNADWAQAAVREAKSLTAREAKDKKVIDVMVENLSALLAVIDGRRVKMAEGDIKLSTQNATVERRAPDWRTRFLSLITDPNIAFLLMTLGAYGLIYEFANPGAFVPGVVGLICLVIGLFALNVLPVNYAGLVLLFLGIAFMVAEAFVPSFGILGIGGTIAFGIGAAILIDTDAPGFALSWWTILGTTGLSFTLLVVVLTLVLKSTRGAITTGAEAMAGKKAEIVDWDGTQGHVRFDGALWTAKSSVAQTFVPGAPVQVLDVQGLTLHITHLDI